MARVTRFLAYRLEGYDMNNVSLEDVEKEIRNKNAKWSTVKHLSRSLQTRDIKRSLGLRVEEDELRALRSAAL